MNDDCYSFSKVRSRIGAGDNAKVRQTDGLLGIIQIAVVCVNDGRSFIKHLSVRNANMTHG